MSRTSNPLTFADIAGGCDTATEAEILATMARLGFPLRRWDDTIDGVGTGVPSTWVAWLGTKPDGTPGTEYIHDLFSWWRQWVDDAERKIAHLVQLELLRNAWLSSDAMLSASVEEWALGFGPRPVGLLLFKSPWTTRGALVSSGLAPRWVEVLAGYRPNAVCYLTHEEADMDLLTRTQAFIVETGRLSLDACLPSPLRRKQSTPCRL